MKAILNKLIIVASFVFVFVACNDEGGETDTRLTAVKTLIEPIDSKAIVLQTSPSATSYFEWEYGKVEDSGMMLYQVAFDKENGDFSSPVYIIAADNNGGNNHATITHKQLNKIAGMIGIGPSETGTFKWTVFSSKGLKSMKSDKENKITVTRLAGFADIPIDLFVTGEGSEGGTDLSKAIKMKAIASGEFEVYTQLTQGKTYQFVNGTTGTPRTFYTSGELIKENGTSTVAQTGIYKISLDFNIGACVYKSIQKVSMFLCWSQRQIELPYKGLGVWGLSNYQITGLSGSDNTDDRYKFRMVSSTGETEWRAPNNDSKPSGKPEYYYMEEKTNVQQWTDGQIWKSPSTTGWSDKTYDISFTLKADGSYTHNLVIK